MWGYLPLSRLDVVELCGAISPSLSRLDLVGKETFVCLQSLVYLLLEMLTG